MRFQYLKKFKWPFDSAITIALLALIISAAQFLLTAPILTNFFVSPKLLVKGSGSDPKADVLVGNYIVTNDGNAPATKIELGFMLQADQTISVLPNLSTNIVEEKSPDLIKNVRIEVDRLSPGESFLVMVLPGPSLQKLNKELAEFFQKSDVKEVPAFSFIRSAEGAGKFIHSEAAGTGVTK
jgi:hypothetical protein